MNEAFSFEDVLIEPQYSDIESRSEISISSRLGDSVFRLPIISAPMDTVTESAMVRAIGECGGLGIIHRYNSIDHQVELVASSAGLGIKRGAAVGVNGDFLERAQALVAAGARIICVDVAHGHHIKVKRALGELKSVLPSTVHLMAGNVATLDAFNDLSDWGADSIRVGIGSGAVCSTRVQTGHGMPTLQSVANCARSDRDAVLIADGGIRTSGDMVKALAAGADFVMLGSLLAGTDETPGDVIDTIEGQKKAYRGMASKEAQSDWRGSVSSIEGVARVVPYRGPVSEVLNEMAVGIRSGLSYSGARSIQELQARARFIRQTGAGAVESAPHIKAR
jgi:IMP dehydrogenase